MIVPRRMARLPYVHKQPTLKDLAMKPSYMRCVMGWMLKVITIYT